ncbi:transglycosylase SLT domain-containing protein [Rhizobium leucaenae]|uniref:transglycosylase SLT domain-containing protein n=1 Tax=Rhizobium leucaenae TaxID=29450 RepID=UPI0007EE9188|nr:transglycosylase SLT domain-containing protein [Rhizobium leucaenae]MBB6304131.1 type IV secretion system protein VirB1 [Rhizobium leucaenae]
MVVSFTDLAETCAPAVAVETLAAVVSLESNFQPFAIRIDRDLPVDKQPHSKAEAIQDATTLIAEHQNIQLGLGGIGIEELRKRDLTISDAFDPCLNLKATATLLDGYYRLAIHAGAAPKQAQRVMLQSYNGRSDPSVGTMVQYDEQVQRETKRLLPKLALLTIGVRSERQEGAEANAFARSSDDQADELQQPTIRIPSWDVFNAARHASALVFQNEQPEQPE